MRWNTDAIRHVQSLETNCADFINAASEHIAALRGADIVTIEHVEIVQKFIAANTPSTLGVKPWCTETGQNVCSCHERDGSYVCDYCKSQGVRGHMEARAT